MPGKLRMNQINNIISNQILIYLILILGITTSCRESSETLFRSVSFYNSGIDFSNDIGKNEKFNIMEYLYFYNGAGIAAGDINNDGLIDLYFTSNQGIDELYLNKGDLNFINITEKAGIGGERGLNTWTTGATMVDINADGLLDIYVCEVDAYKGLKGENRLYINNGNLSFTEDAADYGLNISSYSQQATFFDYDNDGDLDMFLLNHAVHTPESYKRAEVRLSKDSLAGDMLFRNDQGKFTDVTKESGIYSGPMGYGLAVSIGDLNNDFYQDIYVSNDFHENDYLYYNLGNGTFKENIVGSAGHVSTFSMGNDIADFNNDGWLDILTLDMKPEDETILKNSSGEDSYDIYRYKLEFGYYFQYSRNMLQMNRGQLFGDYEVQFSEIGQLAGVATTDWSWSGLMADLDNDGHKDIFVTNGIPSRPNDLDFIKFTSTESLTDSATNLELISKMPEGAVSNYAFRNNGLRFENVSREWGLDLNGYSNGAVCVDLDNDGDLDIVINNLNDRASIYANQISERRAPNYLKVALIGNSLNSYGIGAKVKVTANRITQVQENQLTRGWLSSSCQRNIHFGLSDATKVDAITVFWPDGSQQSVTDQPINTIIEFKYSEAEKIKEVPQKEKKTIIKNVTDISGIDFKHNENYFVDFSVEKLIPHFLSTQGPKIAVGDVNCDGMEDFYIGGAKGQSGELYLQQKNKVTHFKKGINEVFHAHRSFEDVESVFFDADQDADLDLYVVSGGSEPFKGEVMQDRLYINDGLGNFTYMPDALPDMKVNGSCVVPLDVNQDGLLDLFVGGLSTPHEYGLPGVSKLLLNIGGGKFEDVSERLFTNGGRIGMVTDAVWIEERRELIIVGEWMPITIFSFLEDTVRKTFIDNSSGWWNTIHADDIDGDGDKDVLVGNNGLNTDLTASIEEPLDLYIKDFDGNLSWDPVMAYYKQGKQWIYPSLDVLSEQILLAKRKYRTYKSYSNSLFSEIFPDEELSKSYHKQVQMLQSVFIEYDNGNYLIHSLPDEAQLSPVFGFIADDFNNDKSKDIIAIGNFYGNQPNMGRSDASFGAFLRNKGENNLQALSPSEVGFSVYGNVRDIKIIPTGNKEKLILVSRNNDSIRLFSYGADEQLIQ